MPAVDCGMYLTVYWEKVAANKPAHSLHRLLGVDKLLALVLNDWLNDIKKNQVPSVLGGVGPMHSFVQLCKHLFFETFCQHTLLHVDGDVTFGHDIRHLAPANAVKPVCIEHGYITNYALYRTFRNLPLKYHVYCIFYIELTPAYYGIYWVSLLPAAMFLRRQMSNFAVNKCKRVKKLLDCITKN